MSGFDLQEKLIQAKAVMDKVDGRPSNMDNTFTIKIIRYRR